MRLHAVQSEPACFGTGLEQEVARSEEEWRTTIAANAWLMASRRPLPTSPASAADVTGIVAVFWTDRHPDGAPQLGGMWVAPGDRGTGLARRLVGAVEQQARIRGERSVGLWITPDNGRAERFYRRLGYSHTGASKAAPKDPDVAMRRLRRNLGIPRRSPWPQLDRSLLGGSHV